MQNPEKNIGKQYTTKAKPTTVYLKDLRRERRERNDRERGTYRYTY